MKTIVLPTLGKEPLYSTERNVSSGEGYRSMRLNHRKLGELNYQVVLSVVNRPSAEEGKIVFAAERDLVDEAMQKFVNNSVGENDHIAVGREGRSWNNFNDSTTRFNTIMVERCAGILNSFELSGIRDFSKSIAIYGNITVTEEVANMLDSGAYVYALRSQVTMSETGSTLVKIIAFDLLMADELDVSI